ncbi:MAG TPA: LysM domain-containing protein, partial [Polyangiaceae bacterium]
VATLVAVSSKSKAAAGGHTQTFTLDANLPEALRHQVLAALVSGTDPNAIDAFATAIQAQYPLSAGLLHAKATALRSGSIPSLPAASTDPGGPPLDATMPASMVAFVHTELLNETDPNKLVALANTLAAQYPIASALLAQRAAVINVQPTGPSSPSTPQPVVQPQPAPAPSPGASAANPPAPALTIPGLDPGIPADLAQAVMTELATDTDPNKLQTYAQEIQSQYPMAASLMSAKANSLIALAQSLTPPTPSGPSAPAVPATPSLPSNPPAFPPPVNPVVPVVAPAGPSGSMLGMDGNMPPATVQLVVSELANEQDPTKLQALAAQLAPQYPIAAGLLNTRANVILATRPPPTIVPDPSQTPSATVASTYTVQQDDFPWKIAAHFTGHGARWPELVAANPQKTKGKDGNFTTLLPGEKLNLPGAWVQPPSSPASGAVATTNGSSDANARVAVIAHPTAAPQTAQPASPAPTAAPQTAQPAPSPAPTAAPQTAQPAPSPAPTNGLDPGIPANVASAVLAAAKTGTDPAQLRGFASALNNEGFPVAAGLVLAKANTLSPPPGGAPAAGATPAAAHAAPPAATPAATYKVKAGDSPSKIAHALVHDGNRWTELVAANPQKKRAKDGNFATLMPGEVLQLPASWATSTAPSAPSAAHLPQGGA